MDVDRKYTRDKNIQIYTVQKRKTNKTKHKNARKIIQRSISSRDENNKNETYMKMKIIYVLSVASAAVVDTVGAVP